MRINYIYKVLFIIGLPVFLMAQPLRETPYRFMLEAAEEALENNDYYNAVEWYEQCYREQRDKDMAILIAGLHMKLRDYKRAESWYKRVLNRDDDMFYIDERFNYGKVLKYMGQYNDAYAEFQFFIDSSTNEELKPLALQEQKGMMMAKELEENNDVALRLLDRKVNYGMTEYGPAEYPDGTLYYSSFQTNKAIVLDGKEEVIDAKIFTTTEGEDGYEKGTALPASINREGFHTGNVTFSSDGRQMFFTRSVLEGGEVIQSQLFVSNRKDSGWAPPLEVTALNGDYIVTHPAYGELYGNDVLFFSSNMEGGEGGFDLYYATVEGDGFATPVNLGPSINTPMDEITPFYTEGTLYFSSDGYPNLGGYDIFYSTWNGSKWSEVESIGLVYNSSYDDFYFKTYNDGMKGFLVSNRPSEKKRTLKSKTCCDDIYSFGIRQMIIDLITVAENDSGPMPGAEITLIDLSGEAIDPISKQNESLTEYTFFLDPDKPYRVVFKKEGYYPDSLEFNTAGILDDFTFRKNKKLQPMPVKPEDSGESVTEIVTINQAIRLDNIYYDLDDDKILPDAEKDLSVLLGLLEEYPDMVIELSSHTDSRGISSYNKDLSLRRAESAKRWLIERGILEDRIKTVGYGEEQILNRCVNGVRCSEEEHRLNRRTEFKILEGPQSIEITKEVPKNPDSEGGKQSMNSAVPAPKVRINNPEIDLGTLSMGDVKEMVFEITNIGNAALNIELVTSCNCTELEWPSEPIAPGQKGVIKAIYYTDRKEEAKQYREVINIITNTTHIVEEIIFHVNISE